MTWNEIGASEVNAIGVGALEVNVIDVGECWDQVQVQDGDRELVLPVGSVLLRSMRTMQVVVLFSSNPTREVIGWAL